MMQTDKAPEARKGSSLPVLSRSRSGAANACVHTPNTELCCELGGGNREKIAAPSQACAIGPGAATTAPAACISGKKRAGAEHLRSLAAALVCARVAGHPATADPG